MDAAEVADQLKESEERHREALREHESKVEDHEAKERFRTRAALVIAILAAVLAICELGGDDARNRMVNSNIRASDAWALYQAKNMRQTSYRLAADELNRQGTDPALASDVRAAIQKDVKTYEKTIARYEDEPGGDGKKQMQAQAKAFEAARDKAQSRNEFFDYAQMLLQLAVVLGSVSILSLSRPLLWASGMLGCAGLALVLNGYLLVVTLPA